MFPKINLSEYLYELPNDRIAFVPLEQRDQSKLLVVNTIDESISHHTFRDLIQLLPQNSTIFANSSKVLFARIAANKSTGGKAEIFLTEPIAPTSEYNTALAMKETVRWKGIIGGKHIRANGVLISEINNQKLHFTIIEKEDNKAIIEFNPAEVNLTVHEMLNAFGQVPLPPYIKRNNNPNDKHTYQTVYANLEGSVAAPTAGLHFTKEMLEELKASGRELNELTLHVGLGTFKPIDTDNLEEFDMHSERIIINRINLEKILDALSKKQNIVAVGTTSARILESIYWLACTVMENPNNTLLYDTDVFEQDYPYSSNPKPTPSDAIAALLQYFKENGIEELTLRTKLLIVPTYEFKIVNILITNFHQPHSTLILLVAAFLGRELWHRAYSEALEKEYRFLSYGDANLLIREIK